MTTPLHEDPSAAVLMRLALYGHLVSRGLSTVATLGVPDALGTGRADAETLAQLVRADPAALHRLLRALCAFGVFTEGADGTFGLTELGATLRSDTPGSALPTALLAASEVGEAWHALPTTVRTGKPAFPEMFETGFFDHLAARPELRAVFDRSQEQGLALELDEITAALELESAPAVVDVGGGDGALLAHLLGVHPRLTGVLVDRPDALAAADVRFRGSGLEQRCQLVEQDFFGELPGTTGVWVLRHILHDWGDEDCVRLLRNCRRRMPPDARIAVIETERGPTGTGSRLAAVMDLYMMSLFEGGRERSAGELGELLTVAGFTVRGTTSLPMSLTVVHAAPNH